MNIPSEEELQQLSYKTSLPKSLKQIKVKDVNADMIEAVLNDLYDYNDYLAEFSYNILSKYKYRIKSEDSVKLKFERYSNTTRTLKNILNDMLGIRVIVDNYSEIPHVNYLRYVDMTQGKQNDDGYRGLHLYYDKDNLSYSIEIQVWSKRDAKFNIWTHKYVYKEDANDTGISLKRAYDKGVIHDEITFVQALNALRRDNNERK